MNPVLAEFLIHSLLFIILRNPLCNSLFLDYKIGNQVISAK